MIRGRRISESRLKFLHELCTSVHTMTPHLQKGMAPTLIVLVEDLWRARYTGTCSSRLAVLVHGAAPKIFDLKIDNIEGRNRPYLTRPALNTKGRCSQRKARKRDRTCATPSSASRQCQSFIQSAARFDKQNSCVIRLYQQMVSQV